MLTYWIYLLLAAISEALYGIFLFHSRGFTQFWATIATVVSGVVTTIFLGLSMKGLPVGLAFVVWSGLAALGTVLYGIIAMGESRDPMRLAFMSLILLGVIGLKYTSN